jgi:hypothetical protein
MCNARKMTSGSGKLTSTRIRVADPREIFLRNCQKVGHLFNLSIGRFGCPSRCGCISILSEAVIIPVVFSDRVITVTDVESPDLVRNAGPSSCDCSGTFVSPKFLGVLMTYNARINFKRHFSVWLPLGRPIATVSAALRPRPAIEW